MRTRAQNARRQCPRGITDSGVREVWGCGGGAKQRWTTAPHTPAGTFSPHAGIRPRSRPLAPPSPRLRGEGRVRGDFPT
ncbi:hypothetical protein C0V73_19115 [Rhizobium sp. TH135]|nr:hypothetical protein C0V73_19115 [Rhizobium sp. TH135]